MIIGIIASADIDGSGFTSTASVLDFLGGAYTNFGAPILPADFLSDPGRIVAEGLAIVDGDFTGLEFIGAVAARITAGEFTIVVDFIADDALDPNSGQFGFIAASSEGFDDSLSLFAPGFFVEAFDEHALLDDNPFAERDIFEDVQCEVGIAHRIAWTRTPAHAAISVDGRAVISDDTPVAGLVLDRVFCAWSTGYSGTSGYITRVELRPPADDADLPALSALA